MGQTQRIGGVKNDGRIGVTATGQNVDDHCSRINTLIQGFLTGGLDRWKPVSTNASKNGDHLFVTIDDVFQFATNPFNGFGQNPIAEWCPIPQGARFAHKNRYIVPGVVNRLPPTKATPVFCNVDAVLAVTGGAILGHGSGGIVLSRAA